MHDMYMAAFAGILVAGRYPIYRTRFEAKGRLQICWARELRDVVEAALRPGSSQAVRRLLRDARGVYRAAKDAAGCDAPRTRALRRMHEQELDDVLDRTAGAERGTPKRS